jgi:hypothetical protein
VRKCSILQTQTRNLKQSKISNEKQQHKQTRWKKRGGLEFTSITTFCEPLLSVQKHIWIENVRQILKHSSMPQQITKNKWRGSGNNINFKSPCFQQFQEIEHESKEFINTYRKAQTSMSMWCWIQLWYYVIQIIYPVRVNQSVLSVHESLYRSKQTTALNNNNNNNNNQWHYSPNRCKPLLKTTALSSDNVNNTILFNFFHFYT